MLIIKSYQAIFVLLFSVIIISCSSSTEPELSESDLYFHIGDISQYYNETYDIYEQKTIIGKTERSDKQEVYMIESKSELIDTTFIDTSYVFIRNGYYYSTRLEKNVDPVYKDVSPYFEFKLYKVDLQNGDSWVAIEGVPDSIKIVYSADYIGNYETPAGVFENVYSVHSYIKTLKDSVKIYVSKEYGGLGTKSSISNTQLVYIKKQNTELGNKISF